MRTRALSGAETIHVNGEVLEYLIQGNQHCCCAVHTPQCRTYGTMSYAVCRIKYAVREHASITSRTGVRILPIDIPFFLPLSAFHLSYLQLCPLDIL